MSSRLSRPQWAAVAITAAALAAAGCTSSSHSTAAAKPSGSASSPGASLTATQAIQLAAQHAQKVTSFAATVNVRTTGTETTSLAGTVQQQTQPSPVLTADFGSVTVQGQTVPGGIQEILNSNALYLKMTQLARETGKPWIEIPAAEISKAAGASFSQLLQNDSSNPLVQTQMLAGSTNVKKVGTATVDGVPTTEYTGTYPVSAGLAKLPASLRAKAATQLQAMGLQTENFTVWLDNQQQVRKVITSARGSKEQVASTMQVTSINQPVSVTIPAASQTATIPANELGSGSSSPTSS